ncbi:MAG: hypothetical protein M1819_001123 [Sarea resinae]|nr:MAG: hypothetical protein M1819_001123 [Sarea resinae]
MKLLATGRALGAAAAVRSKYRTARAAATAAAVAARPCCQCRYQSTNTAASAATAPAAADPASPATPSSLTIEGRTYPTDNWTNVPSTILSAIPRRLHLEPDHPIAITRAIIESQFPSPTYRKYNTLFPVVSVAQNFDSLGFPADHPGRSRTDTYYLNRSTVLRTHTSAHQADTFRANESDGFLISADVYRRDAIDRSHYPVFHQMEGARMWDRNTVRDGDIARAVWADVAKLPTHNIKVEDPNPTMHAERNPLQADHHSAEEVEAMATHLKRTLENVVVEIFTKAHLAALAADSSLTADSLEPLQVRWVEAYFPFTSPSWELEVFYMGDWLEVLGCGIVQQHLPIQAGVPSKLGWAFGVGLERIAMLLFSIPDIRLFWSRDPRFLSQFSAANTTPSRFVPFSKYPAAYKDVAFWVPSSSPSSPTTTTTSTSQTSTSSNSNVTDVSAAGGQDRADASAAPASLFHENDVMELVREVGGDLVEDVKLIDDFRHPKTGRQSLCYRINYRSLERTLTSAEANGLHDRIRDGLVEKLGVVLR